MLKSSETNRSKFKVRSQKAAKRRKLRFERVEDRRLLAASLTLSANATGMFGSPTDASTGMVEAFTFTNPGTVELSASGSIGLSPTVNSPSPDGISLNVGEFTGDFFPLEEAFNDGGGTPQIVPADASFNVGAVMAAFVPASVVATNGFQPVDDDLAAVGIPSTSLFLVGSGPVSFTSSGAGTLFIGVNDSHTASNSGSYSVTVEEVASSTDIAVTSGDWNVADPKGGVLLNSEVIAGEFTDSLTWNISWQNSSGDKLDEFNISAPIGETNVFADNINAPPSGASKLVAEIVLEDGNLANNRVELDWDPVITVGATIDGDQDENVVGRYFKGIDIPNLNITVELSESLAALKPDLSSVNPADADQELTYFQVPGEELIFKVYEGEFAPEMEVASPSPFAVDAIFKEQTLASDSATIDTIKLPKWLKQADVSYSPVSSGYVIENKLFEIDMKNKFRLPKKVGGVDLWFGSKLSNGVTASASINVDAGLDPTVDPNVGASAKTDIVLLGETIDNRDEVLTADKVTVELDPRTLEFVGGNVAYDLTGSVSQNFGLEGAEFKLKPLTLTPDVKKAVIDYTVGIVTEFDSDGVIDRKASKVTFDIDAEFEGRLSIELINLPQAANQIIKVAEDFVSLLNPPKLVADIFLEAVDEVVDFPSFDAVNTFKSNVNLDGTMNFEGKKESFTGEVSVSESKTNITFDPGFLENFGFEEEDLATFDNGLSFSVLF